MTNTSPTGGVTRTLLTVLLANTFASAVKITTGALTGSTAVLADGIHSVFDCLADITGMVGASIGNKPPDDDHPYGHSKFEAVASAMIGLFLLVAAYEVGSKAFNSLTTGESAEFSIVNLIVMLVTLAINIGSTSYERKQAKVYNSQILAADSKHTLSDALVSFSVIVGLFFVAFGIAIADSIAALVVTVAILYAAYEVFAEAIGILSDKTAIDYDKVYSAAIGIDGVEACHCIRSRGSGKNIFLDLHVLVAPEMPILEAHSIGDRVENAIREAVPGVCDVIVHMEPATEDELAEGE